MFSRVLLHLKHFKSTLIYRWKRNPWNDTRVSVPQACPGVCCPSECAPRGRLLVFPTRGCCSLSWPLALISRPWLSHTHSFISMRFSQEAFPGLPRDLFFHYMLSLVRVMSVSYAPLKSPFPWAYPRINQGREDIQGLLTLGIKCNLV